MYRHLEKMGLPEQIEFLTAQLVKISSVNGTTGEVEKANRMKSWIETYPYFKENPDHVWEQPIPGDTHGRKNIFALVKGDTTSKTTMLYHGHIDTVGVKDYGTLESSAHEPEALRQYFLEYEGDKTVKKEAQSGDWLFGRGALDMQSGDAIHLANLLYFSEHASTLSGNLLVMFNPDEEAEHKGVISAITELKRLQDDEGLQFVGAINSDFISPLYDGDETRYLYTGAAGKLLPSFYIYGREAHVGETLKGIDSTLVASEINARINNNMDLVEHIEGEVVLPPSCLYQRDTKESYDVQIPFKTHMYFNYFLYEENPKDILEKLKGVTVDACKALEEKLEQGYDRYAAATSQPKGSLSWNIEVVTLEEFIASLMDRGVDVKQIIEKVFRENRGMELRELSFRVVDALQQQDDYKQPRVVVFYSPPHCPHNYLKENNIRDERVRVAMEEVVEESEADDTFSVKRFFPFLSDSSYLSLHETDEELSAMIDNFSIWNHLYQIPVKEIRSLSIPAINMGSFGKDAHKWTERVYKPYSFDTLPRLIRRITEKLLHHSEME